MFGIDWDKSYKEYWQYFGIGPISIMLFIPMFLSMFLMLCFVKTMEYLGDLD